MTLPAALFVFAAICLLCWLASGRTPWAPNCEWRSA